MPIQTDIMLVPNQRVKYTVVFGLDQYTNQKLLHMPELEVK